MTHEELAKIRAAACRAGATREQADDLAASIATISGSYRALLERTDRELRLPNPRQDARRNEREFINGAAELTQPIKGKLRQLGLHARRLLEILDELPPWPAAAALFAACSDPVVDQLDTETRATWRRLEVRALLGPLAAWEDPERVEVVWCGRRAEQRQFEIEMLRGIAARWRATLGSDPQAKGPFLAVAAVALAFIRGDGPPTHHTVRRRAAAAIRPI